MKERRLRIRQHNLSRDGTLHALIIQHYLSKKYSLVLEKFLGAAL
jgi:hypothetical protein